MSPTRSASQLDRNIARAVRLNGSSAWCKARALPPWGGADGLGQHSLGFEVQIDHVYLVLVLWLSLDVAE